MSSIQLDTNGLRWFDTSPSAGDPDCTCSHCDGVIADEVPLRLWNAAGQEARLHQRCFALRTGAPPGGLLDDDLPDSGWDDEPIDMGPCCACWGTQNVRNIVCLPLRAPVPGRGWGCLVCGLLSDGAIAVVCDTCLEANAPIIEVCNGYPAEGNRISRVSLTVPFDHKDIPH